MHFCEPRFRECMGAPIEAAWVLPGVGQRIVNHDGSLRPQSASRARRPPPRLGRKAPAGKRPHRKRLHRKRLHRKRLHGKRLLWVCLAYFIFKATNAM